MHSKPAKNIHLVNGSHFIQGRIACAQGSLRCLRNTIRSLEFKIESPESAKSIIRSLQVHNIFL